MKKIFLQLLIIFFVITPVFVNAETLNLDNSFNYENNTKLEENVINIYFFYGEGCPHCAKEEIFLNRIEKNNKSINIYRYETWNNRDNASLLGKVAKSLNIQVSGVPLTIVGNEAVTGYYNDETTGKKIQSLIDWYVVNGCDDVVAPIVGVKSGVEECVHKCDTNGTECEHDCGCSADTSTSTISRAHSKVQKVEPIEIPFIGKLQPEKLSLPFLTLVIGAADGFNPCAMWVLLFLISLLLGSQNRMRMWLLGGAFILSSGIVYFFFLSAWLNLFLFIGFIFWIRLIIGIVAIASGGYHLKEYIVNRDGTCEVIDYEKRKKLFGKVKNAVNHKNFWLALIGIVVLAAVVNLVELVCSAGLPAVYTQVLTLANLPTWQYYLYLIFYIIIFMLDDIIIFVIAMMTLQLKGISAKYTKWANLIGGIIILIIGILLVFKPEWIMFG